MITESEASIGLLDVSFGGKGSETEQGEMRGEVRRSSGSDLRAPAGNNPESLLLVSLGSPELKFAGHHFLGFSLVDLISRISSVIGDCVPALC